MSCVGTIVDSVATASSACHECAREEPSSFLPRKKVVRLVVKERQCVYPVAVGGE